MQRTRIRLYVTSLGALRLELADKMGMLDKNQYNFLWVTEFPLLEWSDEENRFHGNASSIYNAYGRRSWQYIDTDPGRVRAKAYDIVLKWYRNRRRQRPYPSG